MHNEKRKNWRLEYEQIIATLNHIDTLELGGSVFIIPLISWGLMLKRGDIFCLQDILILGKISIGIWLFSVVCFIFLLVKAKKLSDRAENVWDFLNGNNKDQSTHISIWRSLPVSKLFFNYSFLFKLIGFVICLLWIFKYKLFFW